MIDDSFSLMRGGLVYRALHLLGIVKAGKHTTPLVAVLLTTLAMLPVILATGLDGTLHGNAVMTPLLRDYTVIARFLIVVPLLILVAPRMDELLRESIAYIPESGLVHPDNRGQFDKVIAKVVGLRNSNTPETICLLIALLPLLLDQPAFGMLAGVSDWRIDPDGSRSFASLWLQVVAAPVFRFVGLIWLWRLALWTYLLWRLSRIELDLHPAHPDGAAGLSFLGLAQTRFSVLAFAGGLLVAGHAIDHVLYLDATLHSLRFVLITYVVCAVAVLIAPLIVMCPRLLTVKRIGLMTYGRLGHINMHAFDQRWLRTRGKDEPIMLETSDPSAVADFSAAYDTIRNMAVVPITRFNLLSIALAAVVPIIPVFFVAMPMDEIFQKLAGILT